MVRGRVRRDWAEHRIVPAILAISRRTAKICDRCSSPNNISFSFSRLTSPPPILAKFPKQVFNQTRLSPRTRKLRHDAINERRVSLEHPRGRRDSARGLDSRRRGVLAPVGFGAVNLFALLSSFAFESGGGVFDVPAACAAVAAETAKVLPSSPPVTTVFPSLSFLRPFFCFPSLSSSVPSVRSASASLLASSSSRCLLLCSLINLSFSFVSSSLRVSVAPLLARPRRFCCCFVVFFPPPG